MSLVQESGNDPVHFPQRRDVFQFDSDVAAIFPNMAVRSIPLYAEVHRLHAALLSRVFSNHQALDILDVGASRGHFLREVCKRFQSACDTGWVRCYAMENSRPMLDLIAQELPAVQRIEEDVTTLPVLGRRFDVISLLYVLQFIPEKHKRPVIQWAYDHLQPGGVLILGQKEDITGGHNYMHEEYIQFRIDNGYTREEIEAKTTALRGAMWCISREVLHTTLHEVGFVGIMDTSRWLMFSTTLCRK